MVPSDPIVLVYRSDACRALDYIQNFERRQCTWPSIEDRAIARRRRAWRTTITAIAPLLRRRWLYLMSAYPFDSSTEYIVPDCILLHYMDLESCSHTVPKVEVAESPAEAGNRCILEDYAISVRCAI